MCYSIGQWEDVRKKISILMIALKEFLSDNILKRISSHNLFLLKFKVDFDKSLKGKQLR